MIVKVSEFKGKPVIQFWGEDNPKAPAFACGVRKAKIILDHVEDIRRFVEAHKNDGGSK